MKYRAFFIVLAIVLAWPLLGYVERWLRDEPTAVLLPDYQVVLFVTSSCASCERAREDLRQRGISFYEYNLESSTEAMEKFEALGGVAAPLIVVGRTVIQGYNPKALKHALEQRDE